MFIFIEAAAYCTSPGKFEWMLLNMEGKERTCHFTRNLTNMERNTFLQISLLAPFSLPALQKAIEQNPQKGFKVSAGDDRFQEELNIMGGQFRCVVASKDSNGELLIYHTSRREKGGPALHFHHEQDEWFYVLSGEFTVKVGDDVFNLKAGDSAFAPRKIPHAFAKISDGDAQMLVLFQPAGSMEDFFKEMSKLGKEIPKDQETRLKALWVSHGMQIVGAPLKF
ncbi:cupin domain-containing protein [Chryseolinea sp. T2]|uniref:cupin domain-containing protein n=1 Tax=Chryseolinea sp. T2 TaxID=3129255 RepID=UPI003076F2F2